ncbi:chemotaxis protein CheC [Clostridium niameyense]|uniref:Chemotaxis protein CheC n=1 Tax=Clostridium niameyense TaxID=1622073 RepID=A0A6M0R6Q3_9CLOT|nr:chemotaxis protein CheC [Clostridium niameyense]NEZ45855.1 chemotaxis protein CheC [Clostridium niameyense]
MDYSNLTEFQLDALREVANIGTGNSATALSQLLGKKVDMTVPSINIVPFDQIMEEIGEEKTVVGVLVRVLGDTPGNILFIFDKSTALDLVCRLTGMKEDTLTEMGNSVMCEIGNIISTSYMNAIAKFTNLTITPSVPAVTYDMLGAILSTTYIESGQFNEYVLDIETVFMEDGSQISGHFYYVPMPGSLEKILNTLGVN